MLEILTFTETKVPHAALALYGLFCCCSMGQTPVIMRILDLVVIGGIIQWVMRPRGRGRLPFLHRLSSRTRDFPFGVTRWWGAIPSVVYHCHGCTVHSVICASCLTYVSTAEHGVTIGIPFCVTSTS